MKINNWINLIQWLKIMTVTVVLEGEGKPAVTASWTGADVAPLEVGPVVVSGTGEAGAKAGAFHTDPEVARPFIDCRIDWAGVAFENAWAGWRS